jgi:glycosyltransferase involved in cell wall biosynthesis
VTEVPASDRYDVSDRPSPALRGMLSMPKAAIVVPCYNEEEVLPETVRRLRTLLDELLAFGQISDGRVYFVDDGSEDGTWRIIGAYAAEDQRIHGIKLSRNYGHQRALLAGLMTATGDVVISIDADLQDDLAAIKDMLTAYAAGAEVVYGVRRQRQSDTPFKRVTAQAYYSVLRTIGVRLIFNHADYRLLGRRAIEALKGYKETNIFLRGLIPQLGFNSALVYYDRRGRFAGVSKYPLSKMLALAIEGITSFSDIPLKIITLLGLLISIVSFGMAIWALWIKIANPAAVPGWASTVIPVYMLGGVQLLCMGVIGQYLAKIYLETKSRPRFIIEDEL